MVNTRQTASQDLLTSPSQAEPSQAIDSNVEQQHILPQGLPINQAARTPPPRRRGVNPPDVDDVLTQQTEVLAALLRRVEANEQRQVAGQVQPEVQEDPNYNWEILRVPADTSFPVPSTGTVQRMASTLLSKLSTLQGEDNHDEKFALQMTSMWPDLSDEDKHLVFQRLNIYSIVAAVG